MVRAGRSAGAAGPRRPCGPDAAGEHAGLALTSASGGAQSARLAGRDAHAVVAAERRGVLARAPEGEASRTGASRSAFSSKGTTTAPVRLAIRSAGTNVYGCALSCSRTRSQTGRWLAASTRRSSTMPATPPLRGDSGRADEGRDETGSVHALPAGVPHFRPGSFIGRFRRAPTLELSWPFAATSRCSPPSPACVGLVVVGVLALARARRARARRRHAARLRGLDRPSVHSAIRVLAHLGDTLPYACAGLLCIAVALARAAGAGARWPWRACWRSPASPRRCSSTLLAQPRLEHWLPEQIATHVVAQRALDRRHDPRAVRGPRGAARAAGRGRDARRRLRRRRRLRGPRARLALPLRRPRRLPRRRAVDVAGRRRRCTASRRPSPRGVRCGSRSPRLGAGARRRRRRGAGRARATPSRSTRSSARPSSPAR